MATKQIQQRFQVASNTASTANVTIKIDGATVFSGALAETVPVIVPGDLANPATTLRVATFDVDVPVAGPTDGTKIDNFYEVYSENFTTKTLTVSVSGGSVGFIGSWVNWVDEFLNTPVQSLGSADTYVLIGPITHPIFNGVEDLSRYDLSDSHGPGEILLQNGETVEFDISVPPMAVSVV